MRVNIAGHQNLFIALAFMFAIIVHGCTPVNILDGAYLRKESVDASKKVEAAAGQKTPSAEALKSIDEIFAKTKNIRPFSEYQGKLSKELEAFQKSYGYAGLSEEAALGVPENYARFITAAAKAHQVQAKYSLTQQDFAKAEEHTAEAIKIIKKCEFCPYSVARSMLHSYEILSDISQRKAETGKQLINKLNQDLLKDHLESEGGVADFYIERRVLFGAGAQKQFAGVENLSSGIWKYQVQQAAANTMAIAGAVTAANASLQPNSALARSQMQMMNIAASMAAKGDSGTSAMRASPWALPTFTQQLVDPKQGTNTPTIIKGFATNAAQAGGASYQPAAQQLTQEVDALMPYRQAGNTEGAAAQVEKFAEVFNTFLTQVQEIRK